MAAHAKDDGARSFYERFGFVPAPTDPYHLFDEPHFDLRAHLHRVFGVDLTTIPGIDVLTAHTLVTEVGPDLSKFPTPDAFASWLGLSPDNRISGGKVCP